MCRCFMFKRNVICVAQRKKIYIRVHLRTEYVLRTHRLITVSVLYLRVFISSWAFFGRLKVQLQDSVRLV